MLLKGFNDSDDDARRLVKLLDLMSLKELLEHSA
jgi:adenine C2-methylase RlmN of 23S rRNA A2503 and tRNA A37